MTSECLQTGHVADGSEWATCKHILLVDDQPEIRETLEMLLGLDQHTVTPAANAEEALTLFRRDRFDLVITDYAMPGMRGDELARVIKREAPAQPVMMVTGSAKISRAWNNPVDEVLNKPFSLEELRRAVVGVLTAPGS